MEKGKVVCMDKKNGSGILCNKVIISRRRNVEGEFSGLDGKGNGIMVGCSRENEEK